MNQLYLELFHGRRSPGRRSPDGALDDWGAEGPLFGPLTWVHTTYASHVKLGYGHEMEDLFVVEGCLYYDGMYYGDWSAFTLSDVEAASYGDRLQPYDETKADPAAPTGHADDVKVDTHFL